MSYTHFTFHDRYCIFHQQMADFSNAEMGRRNGRHRASIGRELKRFKKHPSWPYCRQYFPEGAQELAKQRRSKPRGCYWTRHRPRLAYVLRGLRQEWSPEQISGRMKEDFPDGRTETGTETGTQLLCLNPLNSVHFTRRAFFAKGVDTEG